MYTGPVNLSMGRQLKPEVDIRVSCYVAAVNLSMWRRIFE